MSANQGQYSEELGLQSIKKSIENEAKLRHDIILSEGKKEAEKIIKEAKSEAEKTKNKLFSDAKNQANQHKQQRISKIKLESQMNFLKFREEVIDNILVDLQTDLQKFTKTKEYPKVLERFLLESALAIGGGDLEILMKKEDQTHLSDALLSKISKEVNTEIGVVTKFSFGKPLTNTIGGLKTFRKDGKILVDDTFEARINRKIDVIRNTVVEKLLS